VPKEAQKAVQEIVWPSYDLNPVIIKALDFESLQEGQSLSDTVIDFYLKYLDIRHKWIKGFHFSFAVFSLESLMSTSRLRLCFLIHSIEVNFYGLSFNH
jgi:hypothetical protein